ncbi:MAG TPA: nucleotide sugar dehydrogenase [Vicinamibacterales bacterium]|jgi:UDP-N-acetyl-D-glucosamine dehydrogenase|nr:nucleotide sugar dehydrogenase [Vicinamibacterales bacterium]
MTHLTSAPADLAAALHAKLAGRTARTGVVGLGYVGLPLAVEFARAGFSVTGIDLDARKVAAINEGRSYIQDVPTAEVARFQTAGTLSATADASVIATLDTINICVPTPLRKTKDPDLSFVVSAVEMIAEHLRPGQLVILESTTYPGTTDEVVKPILERRGLVAGADFFLAFSPERVDPGNEKWTTHNVPKVVGGLTPTCAALAKALYGASVETVVEVSSPRVAEMVKLLENTFRAVNIGLVNELALMCDRLGINVWEVVDAAATKPFGFMPFYPGPGLGGHCIPIDPFYLSWKVKEVGFEARFIELAGHVNGAMPHYVVQKVADALNTQSKAVRGSSLLVLGLSYKRDIDDFRESPAIDVMADLKQRGAVLQYHDPYVPTLQARDWPGGETLASTPLTVETLAAADCVVILTDHRVFDYPAIVRHARLVVDSRNAIKTPAAHVFKLGAPGN